MGSIMSESSFGSPGVSNCVRIRNDQNTIICQSSYPQMFELHQSRNDQNTILFQSSYPQMWRTALGSEMIRTQYCFSLPIPKCGELRQSRNDHNKILFKSSYPQEWRTALNQRLLEHDTTSAFISASMVNCVRIVNCQNTIIPSSQPYPKVPVSGHVSNIHLSLPSLREINAEWGWHDCLSAYWRFEQ